MSLPWQNPGLSNGARAVKLAIHEMKRGVRAAPHGSPNTSQQVARYLKPCVRDLDSDGQVESLGLTVGNWCAAFVCWCTEQSKLPGDFVPHLYRAGVVELVADAKVWGCWRPAAEVREGHWSPSLGDLVVWDRSKPGRPETAWWRHVNRLVRYQPISGRLTTIGGNEGRAIQMTDDNPKGLDDSKLMGFIAYKGEGPLQTEDREEDLRLIHAFVEAHRSTL